MQMCSEKLIIYLVAGTYKWPWSRSGYSLYKQLKKYLDDAKVNPVAPNTLFIHVLSHFQNFENHVSRFTYVNPPLPTVQVTIMDGRKRPSAPVTKGPPYFQVVHVKEWHAKVKCYIPFYKLL